MKKLLLLLTLVIIPFNTYAITDTARSTIVMDMNSKRILYEKNANEPRLIASITKIMTAVVAIEEGSLDEEVTVGEEVLSMYGSNIYIELGEKMTLRNLLYGLMLRSGNDAAVVIAKHIAGSEEKFVELMNKKAHEIGMKNTNYKNCHGLDEKTKNHSTAYDMAILSSYANKNKTYKEIVSTKKWTVQSNNKTYVWHNRNKLLYSYKYTTGGKTGYTPSAGRTLVTTATKNNMNLTVVTLNDGNEYITHKSLYDYYFGKYNNFLIVDRNNFDSYDNFYKDKLYIKKSFTYPLTKNEENSVKVIVSLYKNKNYSDNDKVGDVIVKLKDKEIFKTDVYVKKGSHSKKNIFNKIKILFKKIFK